MNKILNIAIHQVVLKKEKRSRVRRSHKTILDDVSRCYRVSGLCSASQTGPQNRHSSKLEITSVCTHTHRHTRSRLRGSTPITSAAPRPPATRHPGKDTWPGLPCNIAAVLISPGGPSPAPDLGQTGDGENQELTETAAW